MLNRKLFATAFAALTMVSVPAFAEQNQPISKTVQYGDLDLSTPAGIQMLRLRIAAAAYDVCGDPRQPMQTYDPIIMQECAQNAKAAIEPKIAALTTKRIQTASIR